MLSGVKINIHIFHVIILRYHQVRSYDRNIAVNVWWKHIPDFVPQDCDMEPNQTLDNFKFSSLEQEASNTQGQEGFM